MKSRIHPKAGRNGFSGRNLQWMFFALVLSSSICAQEARPHPDNIETKSIGDWIQVRKSYCLHGCGRDGNQTYFVDVLIFAGDTLSGRGYQAITTPFGNHSWQAHDLCGVNNRRWISDKGMYQAPFKTPEEALSRCTFLPRKVLGKFIKLQYSNVDSLKIWPWELHKFGDGWSVLRKSKPIPPGKQIVNTPWGLMRWDGQAKFWRCDKKVIPNDFR